MTRRNTKTKTTTRSKTTKKIEKYWAKNKIKKILITELTIGISKKTTITRLKTTSSTKTKRRTITIQN